MEYYRFTVVIPSFNPDEKLKNTVRTLYENGFNDIIIVNDGSDSGHLKNLPDSDNYPYCKVLIHHRNKGKGAALKTAFKYFLINRKYKEGIITVDGDGQHLIEDVKKCADAMIKTNKIVLGSRNFKNKEIPLRSRFGNKMTCTVFKLFCGLNISDTQTGLRAIPYRYIRHFIDISGNRYEYETNMLLEFKRLKIGFIEVPISAVYIDNNKSSHFRPFRDSMRIYKLIFAFMFSSIFSMIVETIVFFLLLQFVFKSKYDVLWATIIARLISATVNFTLNRNKVFGKGSNLLQSIMRYGVLALPLILCSAISVLGLSSALHSNAPLIRTFLKLAVDTVLFFLSFRIQQNWVFAPSPNIEQHNKTNEKKHLTVKTILSRILVSLGTVALCIVIAVLSIAGVLVSDASPAMRDALVLSAMQASATKWVPGLFMSESKVQKIVDNSYKDTKLTVDIDSYVDRNAGQEIKDEELVDGIKYITERHDNFKCYLMLIPDPERVFVGVSSNDFPNATAGKRIFDMAKKYDFVAAINAGEFLDEGGSGTGAKPVGLTYSEGQCVWNDGERKTFIGIDRNNRLVVSDYMTKEEADRIGIRDAVSFQQRNVLINSDKNGVHTHYRSGNLGAAQRAAIGQRNDGTFIFLVTDGRTASSLGANYNEMIDIMVSYGATNAAMLDGGSSVMMYYEDYYNKYEIDQSSLDEYQLKGLTNKYKAFSYLRRIPTYFCVRK